MQRTTHQFTCKSDWPEGGWTVLHEVRVAGRRSSTLLDVWQGNGAMTEQQAEAIVSQGLTVLESFCRGCGAGQQEFTPPEPW